LETSSHNPHIGGGKHIGSFLKNTNGKGIFSFLVYYTQIKKIYKSDAIWKTTAHIFMVPISK
jgi:hypothetical protein